MLPRGNGGAYQPAALMMVLAESSRRRHSRPPTYTPTFLLLLIPLLALLLLLDIGGSAAFYYIRLPIKAASAMSTADSTSTGSCSTPLRVADEGNNDIDDHLPIIDDSDISNKAEALLELPEATNDPSIPTIKLGESITFEEMGPVIINVDGTTRRIDNWDQMTKNEQEVAWRRIAKRNEERRKVLFENQEQQQ
jgi:hypothetical protein